MIKLTITEKGGEPKPLSFDKDEVTIGRVQGNDIVLPKGNISKRHSKLALADGQLVVTDLKSTNGTYVNGRKISEAVDLHGGDRIFVGDFLIVVDGSPPAAAAESVRRPTPPPPPPPRSRSGAHPMPSEGDGIEAADEELAGLRSSPSTGRGRSIVPPPPPPPRRATATGAELEDDSVDIGFGDAPPSPSEVIGEDAAADAAADVAPSDGGEVFGQPTADVEEDAVAGFGRITTDNRPRMRTGSVPVFLPGSGPARVTAGAEAIAAVGLDGLLTDPTVTTIVIANGADIEVDRGGRSEVITPPGDANAVAEAVWRLASTAQPPPPPDNPVVDVRLADGTRVTAIFPPFATAAISAVIRRPATTNASIGDVTAHDDATELLRAAVVGRLNLLVAGDAGAVAALAQSLGGAIPDDRKVVSVGTAPRGRRGWIELAAGGDLSSLLRAATAFRADHILVAEPLTAEMADVVLAATRGQEGMIVAIAARSVEEALTRLRALTIPALGATAADALIRSAFDLAVFAAAGPAGARVVEIAEANGTAETLTATTVAWLPSERGGGSGEAQIPGVSSRIADLLNARSAALPSHLVRR